MIVVLTGNNSFAMQAELQRLVTDFVARHGDFGLEKFDGEEHEAAAIRGGVTSLPFLSSEKLIVIRSLSAQKELAEELLKLAEHIPDTTTVVIVEPKLDNRSAYAKFLKKETDFKEFKELDEQQLIAWAMKQVEAEKGTISRADAGFLVQQIGPNQQMLAHEIQKLLNYNPQISKQTIISLVEPSIQSTIFQLLEAAFSGNIAVAMRLYQEQRQQKIEPQAIIAMLAWQLHVLALLKTANSRSVDDIAREARLNPFVIRKSQSLARSIRYDHLRQLIRGLKNIDQKAKTSSLDIDEALRTYILGITE